MMEQITPGDVAMSPQIEKLAAALATAQSTIKAAAKNKVNPHFKSKYADLDECWDAVREPLSANGLSVTQWPSATGKQVRVTTMLLHSSGQWMSSALALEARDASPQSIGGAITYGRRYGFSAAVGITADEDDDGNSSSPPPPSRGGYQPTPKTAPFDAKNPEMVARLKTWLEVQGAGELLETMAKTLQGKILTRTLLSLELEKIQMEG